MRSRALITGVLLLSGIASAQTLDVRILDAPSTVWVYSPTVLTAEFVNHGSAGILLPISDSTAGRRNHTVVEIGKFGQKLEPAVSPFIGDSLADSVVWLEPDERWLLRFDITEWLVTPGIYNVRVGLTSTEECHALPCVAASLPNEALDQQVCAPPEGVSSECRCWSGLAFSQVVTITSSLPRNPEDEAAMKWLLSPDYPGLPKFQPGSLRSLTLAARYLLKQHPRSYYAYAAQALSGGSQELVDSWPTQSANSEILFRIAISKMRGGTPFDSELSQLERPLVDFIRQQYLAEKRAQSGPCAHQSVQSPQH